MSYPVLQPGEIVGYKGSTHWVRYMRALFLIAIGMVLASLGPAGFAAGLICLVVALALALGTWFHRWTDKIIVTNHRVIHARGWIARHTEEVNMDQIESVDVDQTVFGRLFNYGDVTLSGTGTTIEPLKHLRNQIAVH